MKNLGLKDIELQRFLAGVIAGLVAAALAITFLIVPVYNRFFKLSLEASRIKSGLRFMREEAVKIDTLEKKRDSLQGRIRSFEEKVLSQSKLPIFLEELSMLAKDCNIELAALKPLEEKTGKKAKAGQKGHYEQVSIYVETRSGFHQLGKFINRLESTGKFTRVSDIKIRANPQSPTLHAAGLIIKTIAVRGK